MKLYPSYRSVSHQVSDTTGDLGDEYSNSSRLHLAGGGNDHPNYAKVSQFPDTDGSSGNPNTEMYLR